MAVQFWVHPSGNIFHLEHKKKFFCLKTSCLSLHYTILYVIYRAVALLTFLIWLMMGQLWSICDHYELLFMCTGIERQITAGRCLCFPPVLICDWSKWWKYKCWEKYAKEILKSMNLDNAIWILHKHRLDFKMVFVGHFQFQYNRQHSIHALKIENLTNFKFNKCSAK